MKKLIILREVTMSIENKKRLVVLVGVLLFCLSHGVYGLSSTSRKIGGMTYTEFSDGNSSTSRKIGGMTYTEFSDGNSCTSRKIGGMTYTDCN